MTLLLAAGTASAFAQGKVSLLNDVGSPITLSSNCRLMPPDCGLLGQPVPTSGPLPSGVILKVGLYAGTSSTSLALQGTTLLNPLGGTGQPPGGIVVQHITLTGIPGAIAPAYFQVRVWDSFYTSYEAAVAAMQYGANIYTGENNIFTMTPGASIVYPSIISGGGSTWTNVGNESPLFVVASYLDCPLHWVPIIDSNPISQTVVRGGTANFVVWAHSFSGYPLRYQWGFNGGQISGATNSSYQITNVQPPDAGSYSVLIWESCGAVTPVAGSTATLTVLVPPAILTPPQSQTAELGADVGFDVVATGDSPLRYQWFFNATNALGGVTTNSHLQLSNVQFRQSGAYAVVVTNGGGAITSPPALLNVIPAVERRPAAALNFTGVLNNPLSLDYTPLLDPPFHWLPLDSVLLTNPAQRYVDASSVLAQQRFYRARQTNGPPSILGLNVVPAITLTGSTGSLLRVDYINQFGPIDAWVTLATVTLTNTTQLYFDTSSIGQPPRLWRLVPLP